MYDLRRRITLILAVAAATAACVAVLPSASAQSARPVTRAGRQAAGGAWGEAQEVPSTAGGGITSVACASAGNCSAGGYYSLDGLGSQAFVVSEVNGTWRKAEEVPGTAALNKDEVAEITSVSCASAGNCSAGGSYDGNSGQEAFVVREVNGTWRKAEEVPGTAALNKEGNGQTTSVSCASAGNCSAGGFYSGGVYGNGYYVFQAFVVREVKGTWRKAEEVPGTAALNKHGSARTTSVSCASAGNCSAGGYYDRIVDVTSRAFVVREVKGTWRKAEEVPGTAPSKGGSAEITSVSCASAGHCSAGGFYDGNSGQEAFVVREVNGTWRKAEEVPGTGALNKGRGAGISSVSCASPGSCSAGGSYGDYADGSLGFQAFVVGEVNGTWRRAEEVPDTAALNKGGSADITSVSCAAPGNCSAGGYYWDESHATQAFVVSEVRGHWRAAEEVPGTAALDTGGAAEISSVSCASAGHCTAGGYYFAVNTNSGAFVVSRK